MCLEMKGLIETCPLCGTKGLSQVSLALDEVCIMEYDNSRGITLTFSRN
jgi:hypothetical protein